MSIEHIFKKFSLIPAIAALPSPSPNSYFSGRTPLMLPIAPKENTIVFISGSIHLKEWGDLHREDRVGMMMGLSKRERGAKRFWLWWWRGLKWWQWWWWRGFNDYIMVLDLHYHISGYYISSLIRQFCQFTFNVSKCILDGVGWLLNNLD